MPDNPYFPRLFCPLKVGERTLRNRVVLSATLTNYGAGHRVTERWTNFLAERAKGGCGGDCQRGHRRRSGGARAWRDRHRL